MQDKISYCPAPLGRGETLYTVQYSGVVSLCHPVVLALVEMLQLQDLCLKVVDDIRLESTDTGYGRPRITK